MGMNINLDISKIFDELRKTIKTLISIIITNNKNKVYIKRLTEDEKQVIMKFYSNSINEFTVTSKTISFNSKSMSDIVNKLCRRNILLVFIWSLFL